MLPGAALFAGSAVLAQPSQRPPGPVVMVHFDYYSKDRAQISALEHRLQSAIRRAGAGELGESELHVDGNDGYLYMYGPDPDRLYEATSSILKSSRLMTNAEVTMHHGARMETFVIHRSDAW
ncbi:hypothetical protein [Paraburkholderia sp.]|uniref:hypothetical protein n=1 Tax=Paraburkholderia sp. TaxID=1926495 RepID=UPI0039E55660